MGETHGPRVGRRIIFPASFIGGPRDMRHWYLDAMALVQRFRKLDIFLIVTCNPRWLEILQELNPSKEAHNIPDLVVRVFRVKLEELKNGLFKKEIFWPIAAYVYVLEFQKRGHPHVHFLIILKSGSKIRSLEAFNRIVSAEL